MNAYYVRCHRDDVPELLALGVLLGVLTEADGQHVAAAPDIVWDVIGTIQQPTGDVDQAGRPVLAPVAAPDGTPLWHANVYTPWRLMARAEQMAAERPEVAEALAAVPRFFVTDPGTGQAVPPRSPVRVLAGVVPE